MWSGEAIHALGSDGVARAKRWLEGTTRVTQTWTNPEDANKLTFPWATSGHFSFDLAGTFYGDDLHGQHFYAEVKNYTAARNQGTEYPKYLAKCYRALCHLPQWSDHFMWITWAPFSVTDWPRLMTSDYVEACVARSSLLKRAAGAGATQPDRAVCDQVAERLWLIVLSQKQEALRISDREWGEVARLRAVGSAP